LVTLYRNTSSNFFLGLIHSKVATETVRPLLLLISRLTRNADFAEQFLQQNGLEALLSFPEMNFKLFVIIIRHLVEDSATLQTAMETEIINTVVNATSRGNARLTAKMFLTNLAGVLCRDPQLFMQAVVATCRLYPGSSNIILAPNAGKPVTAPVTPPAAPVVTTTTTTTTTTTSTSTTNEEKKKKKYTPQLKQVVNTLLNFLVKEDPTPETAPTTTSDSAIAPPAPPAPVPARPQDLFNRGLPRAESMDAVTATNVLSILSDHVVAYPGLTHVLIRHNFAKSVKGSPNMIHFILREFLTKSAAALDYNAQTRGAMANKLMAALCSRAEGIY
jgi:hypothetical protein